MRVHLLYGNSASVVPGFWSGMMNPAALGWLSDHQLGINYYNKYILKELGYRDIAYAIWPNGESGTISAHISLVLVHYCIILFCRIFQSFC